MSILIELPPIEEAQIAAMASQQGVSVDDLIKKAIRLYVPQQKVPQHINKELLNVINELKLQDASTTKETIQQERTLFAKIESGINSVREELGMRKL